MAEISPEEGGAAKGCEDCTDAPLMAFFFPLHVRLTICENKLALARFPDPPPVTPLDRHAFCRVVLKNSLSQKLLLFCCFLGQHSAEAKDYTSQQLAAGPKSMDDLVRFRGGAAPCFTWTLCGPQ